MFGHASRGLAVYGGGGAALCAAVQCRLPRCEEKGHGGGNADHWHRGYRWYSEVPGGVKPRLNKSLGSSALEASCPKAEVRAPRWPGAARSPDEREFTRAQVSAYDGTDPDGKILVTYRDGVYDITDYVHRHPGRHFIMSAAGGPVDPWWGYWMQHHVSPAAQAALEELRVGHLVDYIPDEDQERCGGGLWQEEQDLSSRSVNRAATDLLTAMPYQSQTGCNVLAGSYLTPADCVYVRNHAPVPSVSPEEAEDHTITFAFGDEEFASPTLAELRQRFEQHTATVVLQCTGNRAADNIAHNGVSSSGFTETDDANIGLGMLGNVQWTGIRLAEVLTDVFPANVRALWKNNPDLHVTFEGLDGFYTSTPLGRVVDSKQDCLMATEMNGSALPPDHGFPVRVVLPGVAGARQVKWLSKVTIGPQSNDPWTSYYYRDRPSLKPIQELPMNSVILSPEPGDQVPADRTIVKVRGVAYAGGEDQEVARVEISGDRGQTWMEANCLFEEIDRGSALGIYRGWVRFEADVSFPSAIGLRSGRPMDEIWCRAFNTLGHSQPERSDPRGGYVYNGYHKVPILRRHG